LRASALELIGLPVTVTSGDRKWTISEDQLASALRLPEDATAVQAELDPVALVGFLEPVREALVESPLNATVGWGDDGLYIIEEGVNGIDVDLDRLGADVAAAAATEQREVEVATINVLPTIHGGNLDSLGIVSRLGGGSTSFAGSDAARAENVRVGARWVDQTLIPPQSRFSFIESLGPISTDRGYVEGKIIANNWFESDIGGGVCQVSTTVFRAALLSGLKFIEWHHHSFRLAFYELEGSPPGLDAAIYVPNTSDEWPLDLIFTNPTDSWLLLQLGIDGERITADIYGPDLGYKVELSDPTISDPIPPPEPEDRIDPDLASGVREQAQTEKPGYEVTVRRVVSRERNGDTVLDDTFYSYYKPRPEIWVVGSG
jgi:vancomycin resistance protein YoaR